MEGSADAHHLSFVVYNHKNTPGSAGDTALFGLSPDSCTHDSDLIKLQFHAAVCHEVLPHDLSRMDYIRTKSLYQADQLALH